MSSTGPCSSVWRRASVSSKPSSGRPGARRSPGARLRATSRADHARTHWSRTWAHLLAQGLGVSIDLFGERVDDPAEADQAVDTSSSSASSRPRPLRSGFGSISLSLSLSLSHLALTAGPRAAAGRLRRIAQAVPEGCRVQVGAEEAAVTDAVLSCVLEVAGDGLASRLGATLQANLTRSPADVDVLADAEIHVRLVKGAYLERHGAHPYGRRPMSRSCASARIWPAATPPGRWPLTTGACERRCCWPTPRRRSSSSSGCAPRHSTNYAPATCPFASTSRTEPTGSGSGCAAPPRSRGA